MPSKQRLATLKCKQGYSENSNEVKSDSCSRYKQHQHAVTECSKLRMLSDQTLRKKNARQVKKRLETDSAYRGENTKRAKLSQKKRLETDEEYRRKKQLRAKPEKKIADRQGVQTEESVAKQTESERDCRWTSTTS